MDGEAKCCTSAQGWSQLAASLRLSVLALDMDLALSARRSLFT